MGIKDNFHSKNKEMKYVAAYCMLALAGKTDVSAADLKKFMTSAGVSDLNDDNVNACCDALKGKQLHEVINAGFGKISSLSLGAVVHQAEMLVKPKPKLRLR